MHSDQILPCHHQHRWSLWLWPRVFLCGQNREPSVHIKGGPCLSHFPLPRLLPAFASNAAAAAAAAAVLSPCCVPATAADQQIPVECLPPILPQRRCTLGSPLKEQIQITATRTGALCQGSCQQKDFHSHAAGTPAVLSFTPPCPRKVDDQKLTGPTPRVAWTRVLLTRYTVHGTCGKTWCTSLKIKAQNMLPRPSCPKAPSLTQNMNTTHLKPKVSDSTHSTQCGPPNPRCEK